MFRQPYGQRGRAAPRRDAYWILLIAQLWNQILGLDRKPPVTIALIAAQFAIFFKELLPPELAALVPSTGAACLQPFSVVRRREWRRLLASGFLHADEPHIYFNMSSLLWKGVQLEGRMGSLRFAALVAELLALSHGLVLVGAALLARYIPEYDYLYYDTCAVGFSAVLFGLKVVLQHDAPGESEIAGIRLPTKHLAWAELVLASLANPQASFFGHLCGIVAGIIHVQAVKRVAVLLRAGRRLRRWLGFQAAGSAQYFNSGGVSGRGSGGSSSGGGSRANAPPPTQQPQRPQQPPGAQQQAPEARQAPLSAEELRELHVRRFQR